LHLATGCRNCANDLAELRQVAYEELLDRLRGVEVAVRGGRFSPAGALRGRVGEEAAETVDVAAAYDDFRKGIVDGDRAARDAVETRYREIVAHWIRRDRSARRPEADVDDLTRQTFARFWTRWSSEPFDQLSDISEVLRQLRRTTQDVLRDELRRRRDAENAPS
jgi:hypothetical protein